MRLFPEHVGKFNDYQIKLIDFVFFKLERPRMDVDGANSGRPFKPCSNPNPPKQSQNIGVDVATFGN